MKYYWSCLFFLIPLGLFSQKIVTQNKFGDTSLLNEVTVYANKFPERIKYLTQSIKSITDPSLLTLQPNTGDVLLNSGAVFVQKSQQGGSSPIIRGFEASRVLLMVDGIKLNNAIYRSGHLQNIITIDNTILSRVEILYGPSSTLYGSDALGGVVSMYSKDPQLSKEKKNKFSINALTRIASATGERKGHVDFNIGGQKWASFSSITFANFGDVIQGSNRQSAYPTFGLKNFYVERVQGMDSLYVNPNPNKQVESGYRQLDITQKLLFQPKEHTQHLLNIQLSNSSDVPRYDRLTEMKNGIPVYAEWYYGPQKRSLIAYHANVENQPGFFKEMKFILSYQDLAESRITRKFKNHQKDFRWEQVNVFGFTADAKHHQGNHELHVGVESYRNYVKSTAESVNLITHLKTRISTRYSDGPTSMVNHALYAQHTWKITKRWTMNDGLRLNFSKLSAEFVDTSIMHFPFKTVNQQQTAVTGNLGLVYANTKNFRFAILMNSGFRSPNVDDLTKVFDTQIGYVVVPNQSLKPEYTYNLEINFNQLGNQYSFGGSLFYTWFKNAIVVDRFNFNGLEKIDYQNVLSDVYAPQNKARALVAGFHLFGSYQLFSGLQMAAAYSLTKGVYHQAGSQMPLDHIPPGYGKLSIKYQPKFAQIELSSLFNGWKKIADYHPNGEDNQQYATKDGMPAWMILNLNCQVKLGAGIGLQLSCENILDRNYRYFASGISAPGRNIVCSLQASF